MLGTQHSITDSEFELFKGYFAQKSGIVIPFEKSYLIETRLSKLLIDVGAESFGEYYDYVISEKDPAIHQRLINAITTNETLWFRDKDPWKVLEERILPGLVEKLISREKVKARMWFSAVSTGQEAYSTVMCIDDYLSRNKIRGIDLSSFEFFATDISSHVLEKARRGRYDSISMTRGLSDYYKTKYFTKTGSAWDIEPRIRDAVKFHVFNLQNPYSLFGFFDVIFCRYVLIYFSNELKKEIIAKMHDSLSDDGVLFTGNYALCEMFEDKFDLNHCNNLTYYTKALCGAQGVREQGSGIKM